jgi:D-inositol-3-phosphate glycosyltransferase
MGGWFMKIDLISEHASPLAVIGGVDAGGQNLHVAELAAALVGLGHRVDVYTRRDDPRAPEVVGTETGYQVVHVPVGPSSVLNKDELLPFMGTFGRWVADRWSAGGAPDVAHAHFWMSGVAAQEASNRVGVPVVLTYHALGTVKRRYHREADTSPAGRIPIESRLGRTVARVIAQCADEVTELGAMGVPRDNIDVVPSGVNLVRFTPAGPVAAIAVHRRRILAVGRLVARKGYDDLIRVMPTIDDTELVIVGGPVGDVRQDPEGRRLVDLVQRLGVADRVRLVGAVPATDMPAWYRSADVVACVPWYEPFGLTPLEAMACGAPVVAYAVGGLRETVVHGVTGLQVQPGNVAGLAAALRRMLADHRLRDRCRQAAAHHAAGRYSWPRSAARLAAVYADVVTRTPGWRRPESEKVA